MQTVDAIVDAKGHLQLLAPIPSGKARKAVLTIFDETPSPGASETALLIEARYDSLADHPLEPFQVPKNIVGMKVSSVLGVGKEEPVAS